MSQLPVSVLNNVVRRCLPVGSDDLRYIFKSFYFSNLTEDSESINLKLRLNYGAFGNYYISIKKAVIFALHCKIKRILVKTSSKILRFDSSFINEDDYEHDQNAHIWPHHESMLFYFLDCTNFLGPGNINLRMAHELMRRSVTILTPKLTIPENILVIHIRSGDIFDSCIHPGFAQPPLAWYQTCILLHKSRYPDMSVVLVSQDRANPCVNATIDFSREQNISLHFQSGELNEDYAYLMGASALMMAEGTFAAPALDLNDSLKILYRFSFDYCPPEQYFRPGQWANTEEQLRMMVNLPRESLLVPPDLFERSRYVRDTSLEGINPFKY